MSFTPRSPIPAHLLNAPTGRLENVAQAFDPKAWAEAPTDSEHSFRQAMFRIIRRNIGPTPYKTEYV